MTNKKIQAKINRDVEAIMAQVDTSNILSVKRLRTCSAYVLETESYWILRSYNTVIAIISKDDHVLVDFLRKVYGYTSTSGQHIAKFAHDYGARQRMTWK